MQKRGAQALIVVSIPLLLSLLAMMSLSRQLIVIDIPFAIVILAGLAVGVAMLFLPARLQSVVGLLLLLLFLDIFGMQNLLNLLNDLEPTIRTISKIGLLVAVFGVCLILYLVLGKKFPAIFFAAVAATTAVSLIESLINMPVSIGDPSKIVRESFPDAAPASKNPALPVRWHILLDGHLSPAAMPAVMPGGESITQYLQEFYSRYGFRLYARSYSRFRWTRMAMPSILNFDVTSLDPETLYVDEPLPKVRVLNKSKYFEQYRQRGYHFSVSAQTGYMDFCKAIPVTKCKTIVGTRKTRYPYHMILYNIYARIVRPFGFAWKPDSTSFYQKTIDILDEAVADTSSIQRGDMVFTHIHPPHVPWYHDENCKLSMNLEQGMTSYYQAIKCVHEQLDVAFSILEKRGLLKDAEIVIHGDHGIRVDRYSLDGPDVSLDGVEPKTIIGNYGTLFAIRSPSVEPGYDETVMSVQQLLRNYFDPAVSKSTVDEGVVIYRGDEGMGGLNVKWKVPQKWN